MVQNNVNVWGEFYDVGERQGRIRTRSMTAPPHHYYQFQLAKFMTFIFCSRKIVGYTTL